YRNNPHLTHTHTHTHTHTPTPTPPTHTHTHTHKHTHIHTHTHTHTPTHPRTHTHTHTPVNLSLALSDITEGLLCLFQRHTYKHTLIQATVLIAYELAIRIGRYMSHIHTCKHMLTYTRNHDIITAT